MSNKIWRNLTLWIFIFCIIFSISIRMFYIYGPADLDEGNYATIGMIISKGSVIYRDIGDSKPPLIYFFNAIISILFGSNLQILRLLFASVAGINGGFVFLIAKKMFGIKKSVISALFFIAFSSSPVWGYHSPTNIYSSLFESVAIYSLVIADFLVWS